MTENKQTIVTLHDLLDYDAAKFTGAEIQLKKSLEQWIYDASALKLKAVLQKYLDCVNQHLRNIESFFEEEKFNSVSLASQVMKAFIEETNTKLSKCPDAAVKDAGLLACVQAINHFKISAYGTAAAFANLLGMENHGVVFHQAEVNEKQIDDRLSQLAEHEINPNAKTPVELED
jgi:ferritin-like metal-binding protein YciE